MPLGFVSTLLAFATVAVGASSFSRGHCSGKDVIEKDVLVVGGGASGTYAAVSLVDHGKSVLVVEKEATLGGHTNTYTDKASGKSINVGVQVLHDIPIVHEFMSRLKVPITKTTPSASSLQSKYYNFDTGEAITSPIAPEPLALVAALQTYSNILSTKYDYLQQGYFLPKNVPEELLLPFGEFAKKYDLAPLVWLINLILQNDGNVWELPTVYALKGLDLSLVNTTLTGYIVVKSGNHGDIYTSAAKILGDNVLYNSEPTKIDRSGHDCSVCATMKTPKGMKKVRAKKLVVSILPLPESLSALRLSHGEESVFCKFSSRGYFAAVIEHAGMNASHGYSNANTKNPYNLQSLPGAFSVVPNSVPNAFTTYFGKPTPFTCTKEGKDLITKQLKNLASKGNIPPAETKFLYTTNHSPYQLYVSKDEIKDGFYEKLYSLQGKDNTFWTGAAWIGQDSSLIWNYTQNYVVPPLLKALAEK